MDALIGTYDFVSDTVSFVKLPVVDGKIHDGYDEPLLLSEVDIDSGTGGFDCIAAVEPDTAELRDEITGILMRRFEAARDYAARQARIRAKGVQ